MTSLLSFDPLTLERIFKKCNERGYCRLQMTCRSMYRFVRSNANVNVPQELSYKFDFTQFRSGIFSITYSFSILGNPLVIRRPVDIDGFYGIRMKTITLPKFGCEQSFSNFCKIIEIYNITCTKFTIDEVKKGHQLNLGECLRILKALRPTEVYLPSRGSNRYEALLYCQNLKVVEIIVDTKDVLPFSQKLTPLIPIVGFAAVDKPSEEPSDLFSLTRRIERLLNSAPKNHRVYLLTSNEVWAPFTLPWEHDFEKSSYFPISVTRIETLLFLKPSLPIPEGSHYEIKLNGGQVVSRRYKRFDP